MNNTKTKYQINKEKIESRTRNEFITGVIRRLITQHYNDNEIINIPREFYFALVMINNNTSPDNINIYGRQFKLY